MAWENEKRDPSFWYEYIVRFEGGCRDCADSDGTCDRDNRPCDSKAEEASLKHAVNAIQYGLEHQYLRPPYRKTRRSNKLPVLQRPVFIKVTIPSELVTKSSTHSGSMYEVIYKAFGLNMGRGAWNLPVEIIATFEQYGNFCALMSENNMGNLLPKIDALRFREGETVPTVTKFNVIDNNVPKVGTVPLIEIAEEQD